MTHFFFSKPVPTGHVSSYKYIHILRRDSFFFRSRSRRGEARMLYQQALEMKTDDPHTLGEFAFFLEDRCKDYTAAQVIFGNIR